MGTTFSYLLLSVVACATALFATAQAHHEFSAAMQQATLQMETVR